MKKKTAKTILECFISILLLFIPFIFANYFITSYYLENDKFFWDYDILVIMALEWLSAIAVSLVIRKKNKNAVSENFELSKKIFFITSALFIVIGVFVLLDGYAELYGKILSSSGILDEWPLALIVIWEQYLDGTFLLTFLMSIAICFYNKTYFGKNKSN